MTRFARAKGSKSSNERVPEAATPWSVLSQQLEKKSSEHNDSENRKKFEEQRRTNYNQFLKDESLKKSKDQWCEFPTASNNDVSEKKKKKKIGKQNVQQKDEKLTDSIKADGKLKSNKKKLKKKNKAVKNVESDDEFDIEDSELTKWCDEYSNEETNLKYKELTKKLESVCQEEEKKLKSETPLKKNKNKKSSKRKSEDDDVLETVEEPQTLKKKKKKVETFEGKANNLASEEDSILQKNTEGIKNKTKSKNSMKKEINKKIEKGNKIAEKKDKNQQKEKNENSKEHKKKNKQFNDKLSDKIHIKINGEDVEVVKLQGFPVTSKDAQRILELRKALISKGIPRSEVDRTIKLERRRAEKTLARLKKSMCFHCRKGGHILSECPEMNKDGKTTSDGICGICFKCGSTEHTHFNCKVVRTQDFKFAQCFICKEQGHISRQCPDNPKGIYPKGGACRVCGDVTHLRKDCPKVMQEYENNAIRLETLQSDNIEDIKSDVSNSNTPSNTRAIKHVRF